jgi:hypothetical protein
MKTGIISSQASPTPNQLVSRLENCQIVVEPSHVWTIRVLGFHVLNGDAWLQLRLLGRPSYGVVVHCGAPTTANEVLGALKTWLCSPGDDRPRTIEVLAVM